MNNIKKSISFVFVLIITILLCSCDVAPSSNDGNNISESSGIDEQSIFVGEWKCLKENSCNNMEITLSITQENGELNVVRDMQSDSPSGSKITFSVDIPEGTSFYSSHTKGTYELKDSVLQETFENGKTNYYSVTGELSTNICEFPFCSKECGDVTYCEAHNTTDKRYSSLTDSNKQSICYYIEGRYDYYDSLNNGYAGDKYSDQIMQEAASKYGITSEQAYIIWMNYYSY